MTGKLCHAAVNDIVHHAMSAAHLPSWLEPTGLSCSNGKRPDGVTLVPWKNGRLLVWDATCPDTISPSHLPSATREAGAVAALAERSKQEKYTALNQCRATGKYCCSDENNGHLHLWFLYLIAFPFLGASPLTDWLFFFLTIICWCCYDNYALH